MQHMAERKRRRTLLAAFAHQPAGVVREAVAAHSRELRVGAGGKDRDPLEVCASGAAFQDAWAEDAVLRHLAKQAAAAVAEGAAQRAAAAQAAMVAQQQLMMLQQQHMMQQMQMQAQMAAAGAAAAAAPALPPAAAPPGAGQAPPAPGAAL
jgi:hypothetical protein